MAETHVQLIREYLERTRGRGESQTKAGERIGLSQGRISQLERALDEGEPVRVEPEPLERMAEFVAASRGEDYRAGWMDAIREVRDQLDRLEARLGRPPETDAEARALRDTDEGMRLLAEKLMEREREERDVG